MTIAWPDSAFDARQISRRDALSRIGGGLGALGLTSAAFSEASGDSSPSHFRPRARAVIQLFMNGGPFGPDFFDPKPALTKYAGQRPQEVKLRTERATAGILPSPFEFRRCGESGLPVSELLPKFGQYVDDVCVLKSVYTDNPNHGPALYLMNNGTITENRPSLGSWLSYGLGSENDNLPRYVVLCPGRPVRFAGLWTNAFLPAEHQGTYINHSNIQPDRLIPYLKNQELTPEQQAKQLALVSQLNRQHLNERSGDSQLEARIEAMETAYRMQFEATDAFDVKQETGSTRQAYGEGHFANGCLLARRLVERGVRFVQVYYGNGQPWDTHDNHHDKVRGLAEDIDQPMAALLGDLRQRGLLDDTLVLWGGEFGRTPTSENGNGRDHNHYGSAMWMAGGGVKGGLSYGETDEFGFRAMQDRVHIHDLHATILHLLGLDHERLTYRYAGRDYRLTDVAGRVLREVLS